MAYHENAFGFSRQEVRVYRALSALPQTVAKITSSARVPRMTVHDMLQRFLARGIVKRTKRSGRYFYEKSTPSTSDESRQKLVVHRGEHEILAAFQRLFALHAPQRVYVLESTCAVAGALRSISYELINETNAIINESGAVIETVVEEDFFVPIQSAYGERFDGWLETFLKRTAVVRVTPEGALPRNAHHYIFRDTAFIMDWKRLAAVEVREPMVVESLRHIAQTALEQGRKTNFHIFAREKTGFVG